MKINRIQELISILNQSTADYELGNDTISDTEWDKLYFELKTLEEQTGIIYPYSPTQIIHYDVINELNKVEHNHPMLSLDKTKDWNEFLQYFSGKDVVGMLKLDGLTCSLRYLDGKLVSAETRGNGIVGEDILHNARVISNIPQSISYKGEYIVDGEIICAKADFAKFADKYANPRNFAAGSIRLLSAAECGGRKLRFVVWNIIKGTGSNDFIDELTKAEEFGFEVVSWTSSFDWDAKEFLLECAENLGYPIDGLVGRFNDIAYGESLGATGHHSKAAFAFKFEDELYDTKLLNIEWTMGRSGALTPVAVFEPVDTGDSVVERANLHNVSIKQQLLGKPPYVNEPIKIYLANMIIPQVKWGDAQEHINPIYLPQFCPICGGATMPKEENSSTILYCTNTSCEGKLINKLDHFLGKQGLDIKGISKATIEKLIDWGWIAKFSDLFTLSQHRSEWIKKPGFGPASVDKILSALENGKRVSLTNFIAAIGIPMVGKSLSKELVKYINSYEDFRNKVNNKYNWLEVSNLAETKRDYLNNFDYSDADEVAALLDIYTEDATPAGTSLEGKVFVITGRLTEHKNRDELVAKITAAGGKVSSSISKNTSYLINNDTTSTSAKNLSAQKLGIPIISESQLVAMI